MKSELKELNIKLMIEETERKSRLKSFLGRK